MMLDVYGQSKVSKKIDIIRDVFWEWIADCVPEESKIEEVFSLQGGRGFLLATGKQMLFLRQEKDRMRKVIVSEVITLDGFFAGPNGLSVRF